MKTEEANAAVLNALLGLLQAIEAGIIPHPLTYVGREITKAKEAIELAKGASK